MEPARHEATSEEIGVGLIHENHGDASVALRDVHHLEVGDVDTKVGRKGEDLCRRPGTVRDRDPELGERLGMDDPARQVASGVSGHCEAVLDLVPIAAVDRGAQLTEIADQVIERVDDGRSIRLADVESDVGTTTGDPRHVPEPARSEAQERGIADRPVGGEAHE